MLYVTTRSDRDVFTAQKVLRENRGPDGGFYIPFRMSGFSKEELDAMTAMPFPQRLAEVLNRLFQTKLSAWDVEFAIGRWPVQMKALDSRIWVGECWHNPEGSYARLERNLGTLLTGTEESPGSWVRIAVGIALFGSLSLEAKKQGVAHIDLAMPSGTLTLPVSAWYARAWGFPIGNILLCSREHKNLWDLLSHGQIRTNTLGSSPDSIPVPPELERLIYGCGGREEVERFLTACRQGSFYCPMDGTLRKLRQGLYASVISSGRVMETIPAVYRTHRYPMSEKSALAYAGLLDYRARTGETGIAMVLAEDSPARQAETIGPLLGITAQKLKENL